MFTTIWYSTGFLQVWAQQAIPRSITLVAFRRELPARLVGGFPVALADGLQHPSGDRLERPGVLPVHELRDALAVLVLNVDLLALVPESRVNVLRHRLLEPEEVFHVIGHLERPA
jgi:hypothetical protein